MKKIIVLIACCFTVMYGWTQAKKPTIMVIPSRAWCIEKGYYTTIDNFGVQERSPDFRRALDENPDLLLVISKINGLFIDRGFTLRDLGQAMQSISNNSSEDFAMNMDRQAAGKATITESALDKIKNVAKADYLIEITWKIANNGPNKYLTFIMKGLDVYTDKEVASSSGASQPSMSSPVPVLLEEAVLHHIDNFNARLQAHFDDMAINGREIKLELAKFNSWDKDFETEVNGEELGSEIEKWMAGNTVKGRFTTAQSTDTRIIFDQVRIPLYDANKVAMDARSFGKLLQKFLKANYSTESKIDARGLGHVVIYCGKK